MTSRAFYGAWPNLQFFGVGREALHSFLLGKPVDTRDLLHHMLL